MRILILISILAIWRPAAAQIDTSKYEAPTNPDGWAYLALGATVDYYGYKESLSGDTLSDSWHPITVWAQIVKPMSSRVSILIGGSYMPKHTVLDYEIGQDRFVRKEWGASLSVGLKFFFPSRKPAQRTLDDWLR